MFSLLWAERLDGPLKIFAAVAALLAAAAGVLSILTSQVIEDDLRRKASLLKDEINSERSSRLEMERKMGYRTLTRQQCLAMIDHLSKIKTDFVVAFSISPNIEPQAFANHIAHVFSASGAVLVAAAPPFSLFRSNQGLRITLAHIPQAENIKKAFEAAEISTEICYDDDFDHGAIALIEVMPKQPHL